MDFYSIVQVHCDKGDSESEIMYQLHSKLIKLFLNEYTKTLKKTSNIDFINLLYLNPFFSKKIIRFIPIKCRKFSLFNNKINKIKFLLYYLNSLLFVYLDRFYTKRRNIPSLNENAYILYINEFFIPIKDKLFMSLSDFFKEINIKESEQNIQDIKNVIQTMKELDELYKPKLVRKINKYFWESENDNKKPQIQYNFFDDWFNNYLLKDINILIEKEKKEIENLPISEYIMESLNMKYQPYILQKYFDNKYYNKISNIIFKNIIENKKEEIEEYFLNMNREQLKNFYEKNKTSKFCLYLISQFFIFSIEQKGIKMFENKGIKIDEKDTNICYPIELKKEIEKLFSDCFDKEDPEYNKCLFIVCQNLFYEKSYSKKLAIYINECMRKRFKGKSEKEISDELEQIKEVFILLLNKIDFKLLSERYMSERLIKNAYLSLNTEKKFISILHQEAGYNYVNKMSEMISDLDKSNIENEEYNKLKDKSLPNDIKFKTIIISESAWKINPKYLEKMNLPVFLSQITNDFEKIYANRHYYSKLIWLHYLSKVDIKYICFKDKYESKSTLLQFLILLQIEKEGKLTLKKIAENIGCKVNLVLEDISGLIFNQSFNPQHKKDKGLLLGNFDDKTIEFKETDEVWFNYEFKNNHIRFSTIPLNIKKSESEIKKEEKLDELNIKKYQDNIIQAKITNIMKANNGKSVKHVWLLNEVSKQILNFKAQPQQIKENIEKIIEKAVIKRDEKEIGCYLYIA